MIYMVIPLQKGHYMRYSTYIKAKVSPEIKDKLEATARSLNITASEVVRELIMSSDKLLSASYRSKAERLEGKIDKC